MLQGKSRFLRVIYNRFPFLYMQPHSVYLRGLFASTLSGDSNIAWNILRLVWFLQPSSKAYDSMQYVFELSTMFTSYY